MAKNSKFFFRSWHVSDWTRYHLSAPKLSIYHQKTIIVSLEVCNRKSVDNSLANKQARETLLDTKTFENALPWISNYCKRHESKKKKIKKSSEIPRNSIYFGKLSLLDMMRLYPRQNREKEFPVKWAKKTETGRTGKWKQKLNFGSSEVILKINLYFSIWLSLFLACKEHTCIHCSQMKDFVCVIVLQFEKSLVYFPVNNSDRLMTYLDYGKLISL